MIFDVNLPESFESKIKYYSMYFSLWLTRAIVFQITFKLSSILPLFLFIRINAVLNQILWSSQSK